MVAGNTVAVNRREREYRKGASRVGIMRWVSSESLKVRVVVDGKTPSGTGRAAAEFGLVLLAGGGEAQLAWLTPCGLQDRTSL